MKTTGVTRKVNESKMRTQFELEKLIGELQTDAQKQVVQADIELLRC